MIILGIETSCDDTCVAILKIQDLRFKILSNIISSQVKLHAKYGGVYPTLAKREHQKNLPLVLKKALKEASFSRVDLIAVTVGPGLEPCLWVGINFAKDLAKKLDIPIIPVNHIEAHILANWLKPISETKNLKLKTKNQFPAICLIVSGGHTQLILMKNIGNYRILGETRDDAAGECFDKIARILGLGYPGGPAIAKIANLHKSDHEFSQINISEISGKFVKISDIKLPRPMIYQKNYDFSFSGLKTAVLYHFRNQPKKVRKSILRRGSGLTLSEIEASKKYIQKMCFETQQAVIDVLIHKTLKAAKDYKVKSIILGGGVAANDELRKQFNYKLKTINSSTLSSEPKGYKLNFLVPPKNFCTDNAVMVAVAGYFHWLKIRKKEKPKDIEADANQRL
jgi:N6-L-threonylcarbamoyladenine synthase